LFRFSFFSRSFVFFFFSQRFFCFFVLKIRPLENRKKKSNGRMGFVHVFILFAKLIALLFRAALLALKRAVNARLDRTPEVEGNVFLQGNFAPVTSECAQAPVSFASESLPPRFPPGCYVRNGPNVKFAQRQLHWFDGDGMLHAVHFFKSPHSSSNANTNDDDENEWRANYHCRWIRTDRFVEEEAAGRQLHDRLRDMMSADSFALVMLRRVLGAVGLGRALGGRSTANTALVFHNRELMALVEADWPYVVEAPRLDTVGKQSYGNELDVLTAHPKVDADSGEMIGFCYRFGSPSTPKCTYYVVRADGVLTTKLDIAMAVPTMQHDFAVSRKRVVFLDFPVTFRAERALDGKSPLMYEPAHGARFGVLPRRPGVGEQPRWLDVGLGYMFHVANCWDDESDDDVVHVLGCHMRQLPPSLFEADVPADAPKPHASEFASHLRLYSLNVRTGGVDERYVDDGFTEFPLVDGALSGRFARYAYASLIEENTGDVDQAPKIVGVRKFDVVERRAVGQLLFGGQVFGGEFSFVRADDSTSEDDGYLVSFVTDEATMTSYFIVLDARSMNMCSRIELPRRVPYGFHGRWLTQAELESQKSQ
jgi:carotenoid 9,10(9',10')-cleavage dioxygenase 1